MTIGYPDDRPQEVLVAEAYRTSMARSGERATPSVMNLKRELLAICSSSSFQCLLMAAGSACASEKAAVGGRRYFLSNITLVSN